MIMINRAIAIDTKNGEQISISCINVLNQVDKISFLNENLFQSLLSYRERIS